MPLLPAFESRLTLRHDRLGLDFVNTAGNHASAEPHEWLQSYADLLEWAEDKRLLPAAAAAQLRAEAERHPAVAEAARAGAVELREALYRLFLAHVHAHTPEAADLAALNTA